MKEVSPSLYEFLSIPEATEIQRSLRSSLCLDPLHKHIKTIAGADISLNRFSEVVYAGIVLLDYESLRPIGYSLVEGKTSFPYVPGYLAFREVPALMQAFEQMEQKPDVLMLDGHGIAHPRRMGIAAHFGALADVPTLGCAKKKLYGQYEEPDLIKGSYTRLHQGEEQLGYVLRTKNKVKPVYVSPGNRLDFEGCLQVALHCSGAYRLPEPTRRAHEFVNLFRKGMLQPGWSWMDDCPDEGLFKQV